MHRYCLDTSGITNPLATIPEDIFLSCWSGVIEMIEAGLFCCNAEVFSEYEHINGNVGECLKSFKTEMVYEIGDDTWDWAAYVDHVARMHDEYRDFISEYNGNRKATIGTTDLSLVALAKTLGLPVVSMEALGPPAATKMRIPALCEAEDVTHLTFQELLRKEGKQF